MELNVSLREIAAVRAMESLAESYEFGLKFSGLAAGWMFDDFDNHTEENFRRYVGRMAKLVSIELKTRVHILYGTPYPFGFGFKIYGIPIYMNFKKDGGRLTIDYKLL